MNDRHGVVICNLELSTLGGNSGIIPAFMDPMMFYYLRNLFIFNCLHAYSLTNIFSLNSMFHAIKQLQ